MSKTRAVALTPLERYLRALGKQNRAIHHATGRKGPACWRSGDFKAIEAYDNELHVVWAQLSREEKMMIERGVNKEQAIRILRTETPDKAGAA